MQRLFGQLLQLQEEVGDELDLRAVYRRLDGQ